MNDVTHILVNNFGFTLESCTPNTEVGFIEFVDSSLWNDGYPQCSHTSPDVCQCIPSGFISNFITTYHIPDNMNWTIQSSPEDETRVFTEMMALHDEHRPEYEKNLFSFMQIYYVKMRTDPTTGKVLCCMFVVPDKRFEGMPEPEPEPADDDDDEENPIDC